MRGRLAYRVLGLLFLLLVAGCGGGSGGGTAGGGGQDDSVATTLGLDNVGATGATLRGTVDPGGLATTGWFEWGTDPALASPSGTTRVELGSGTGPVSFSFPLTGLEPGTTYYFRAVAENGEGTWRGNVDYFATDSPDNLAIAVNCPLDNAAPPPGKVTLRSALDRLESGGTITFVPALDNATIDLSIVGEAHSVLKGEIYDNATMRFLRFDERDYGRSALYARKDVTIDASSLPHGVTLRWAGGETSRARVLAVYGNLTMNNVGVTSGCSAAEALPGDPQQYTLARGGGIAVWGTARLQGCTIWGNRVLGDTNASRDRGAFGGGIYGDCLALDNCVVAGNGATGYGAAGGGIYSVSGTESWEQRSRLTRCAITGNRVTGQHAYGGGVYTDGGGPGSYSTLQLQNCTVARNVVEDHPGLPDTGQYYYRGGGIYMSNGYLSLSSCTIAENEVTGTATLFRGKPNVGGGGVAATIGNAHVVEDMTVMHSAIVGNRVNGAAQDLYTGSLLHFFSLGYNRVGAIDFSQMLVPLPAWGSLCRKHWPKEGDLDNVSAAQVLVLDRVRRHSSILSAGTDNGANVVLWYPPAPDAVDRIPDAGYTVDKAVYAEYPIDAMYEDEPYAESQMQPVGDFLNLVLEQVRTMYGDVLGSDFGTGMDPSAIRLRVVATTWPSDNNNAGYIRFWRDLDDAIAGRLGPAGLGDDFWASLEGIPFGPDNIAVTAYVDSGFFDVLPDEDQLGRARPGGGAGDIGAIEGDPEGGVLSLLARVLYRIEGLFR